MLSSTEGLNLRVEGWRLEGQATNADLAAGLLGGMPVWPEAAQQAAKAHEGPSEVRGWVVPHPEPLGREVQAPEPTWAKQTATQATCSGPPSSRPEAAGCLDDQLRHIRQGLRALGMLGVLGVKGIVGVKRSLHGALDLRPGIPGFRRRA